MKIVYCRFRFSIMVVALFVLIGARVTHSNWPTNPHQFIPFYSDSLGRTFGCEKSYFRSSDSSIIYSGLVLNAYAMGFYDPTIQVVNSRGELPLGSSGINILPQLYGYLYPKWERTQDGFIFIGTQWFRRGTNRDSFSTYYQRVRNDLSVGFGNTGIRLHPEYDTSAGVIYCSTPGILSDEYFMWSYQTPRDSLHSIEFRFIEHRDSMGQVSWRTPNRFAYFQYFDLAPDGEGGIITLEEDSLHPFIAHYRANGSIAWRIDTHLDSVSSVREVGNVIVRNGNYVVVAGNRSVIFFRYSDGGFERIENDLPIRQGILSLHTLVDGFFIEYGILDSTLWYRYNSQCRRLWCDTIPFSHPYNNYTICLPDGRIWISTPIGQGDTTSYREILPNGLYYDSSLTINLPCSMIEGINNGIFIVPSLWVNHHLTNTINYLNTDFRAGTPILAVKEMFINVPESFNIKSVYPNPFNSTTTIEYSLPKTSKVELKLFDLNGREVRTLVDVSQNAGTHRVSLDGSNLSSGTYFFRLNANGNSATKKLILLK